MRRSAVLTRLCLCVLTLSACSRKSEGADDEKAAARVEAKHGLTSEQAKQALVVIGDTKVTVGDFAEQLAEKSPYLRARYASPERRRELLEELVKFELLAKEAARRGLDASEEVLRTKKQLMVQQMMKVEFEDKVKLSDISEHDIQAYYDAHPEEFNKPPQVRASVIVVKDEPKAKRLLKQVAEKPEDNELFRQLASTHNEDPLLKERFGDLQFFSRPSDRKPEDPPVPDGVAEAAFTLADIGQVYPQLVKTEQGFHIIKLTGRRRELARTLEQTRRPIQHKLWRERREAAVEAFVKSLRDKAEVQENWALLEQVKVELPANDAGVTPVRNRRTAAGDRGRP